MGFRCGFSRLCHAITRVQKCWVAVALYGALQLLPSAAEADVIVLANRSTEHLRLRVSPVASRPLELTLRVRETVPIFVDGRAHVQFPSGRIQKKYLLDANNAYYFGNLADGRVELQKIGLNDSQATAGGRSLPGSARSAPAVTIPVKLLVDEEEPAKQILWEPRLRKRVEQASAILEKHCLLKLKVVAMSQWDSDDRVTEFFDSFAEFEQEVAPFPGQIAIGFTSQYQVPHGRVHLGGTRGPFHTHILIREWSQHVGEKTRLELLVHELGHFLGASHSPEHQSVMRPVLGGGKTPRTNFAIQFDPVNTLIMAMVVEEVRRRHVRKMDQLTLGTKRRLREIYGGLSDSVPKDSAGRQLTRLVESAAVSPLVKGTRHVVKEIVRAARDNHQLPAEKSDQEMRPARLDGDALTELYVRRAAAAAATLSEDAAAAAFLLGLGIALDDTDTLRKLPKTQDFVKAVESTGERSIRQAFLGTPTMLGREDLAKHFAVSAYLTAADGSAAAESAGIAKEVMDSRSGGSGFSFADMAANKAGILFAGGVLKNKFPLNEIALNFTVAAYMPSVEGLTEGIHTGRLLAQFGRQEDPQFQNELKDIEQRVLGLPPYQLSAASGEGP